MVNFVIHIDFKAENILHSTEIKQVLRPSSSIILIGRPTWKKCI